MATTVIFGAGIIGVSTAYYLSERQPGSSIHLVEPSPELFSSASGFAGGFLARDWFAPATAELGALSFDEHRRLAEAHGGAEKWGYTSSTSISYSPASLSGKRAKGRGDDWLRAGTSRADAAAAAFEASESSAPSWLRRDAGDQVELISSEGTTAQLDPRKLCHFLLQECLARGVHLHHPAKAISAAMLDVRGELSSVRVADLASSTETDVPCTRVVVAAGVWSPRVFATLFPRSGLALPVTSLAGHSLVVRSPRWGGDGECHAVFATGGAFSPEVFSRAGGEIFVGGLNSAAIPVPEVATGGGVSAAAVAQLKETTRKLLGPAVGAGSTGDGEDKDDLVVLREGLCFRPVTPAGVPIVSRVEDEKLGPGVATRPGAEGGVFVAAGHGPWGISQSLGTGVVLAEMAQGRKLSADVSALKLR